MPRKKKSTLSPIDIVFNRRKSLLDYAESHGFITVDIAWSLYPDISRSAISNDLRWLTQGKFLSRSVSKVDVPPFAKTYKFTLLDGDLKREMIGKPIATVVDAQALISIEQFRTLPRFLRALAQVDTGRS